MSALRERYDPVVRMVRRLCVWYANGMRMVCVWYEYVTVCCKYESNMILLYVMSGVRERSKVTVWDGTGEKWTSRVSYAYRLAAPVDAVSLHL